MDTLVLSRSYEPVARVDWKRAITLLFEGKCEVVEEYEDWTVHSVTLEIKVPSVIRFLMAARSHKRAIKFSRQNVYARDGGRCQYCGDKVPRHEATYDHVVPRSQNGATRWENIVIACGGSRGCNSKKANRTPEQAGMRLLSKPVKPKRLPGGVCFTMTWQKGMPEGWRAWLKDVVASTAYWHQELDSD